MNQNIFREDIAHVAARPFMQALDGKRILIVGASGMIGHYLVETLLEYNRRSTRGCSVITLCRDSRKLMEKVPDFNESEIVVGDICDSELRLPDFDYAIFAAGYTDFLACQREPVSIYMTNTAGIHNLLEKARFCSCKKVCYISSASVYGKGLAGEIPESAVGIIEFSDVRWIYSQSKRMGEAICNSYSGQYGLDTRIVRPFHMYGPNMNLDNSGLVYSAIKRTIQGQEIKLDSSGGVKRNFTYLRDIIRQILAVTVSEKSLDRAINLGSEENTVTVLEFAKILSSLNGKKPVIGKVAALNPTNDIDLYPKLELINSIDAFCDPNGGNMRLEDGLRRTIEFYRRFA